MSREEARLAAFVAQVEAASDIEDVPARLAQGALSLVSGVEGGVRAYDVDGDGRIVAFWIATDGVVGPTRCPEPPPGSIAEEIRRGGRRG